MTIGTHQKYDGEPKALLKQASLGAAFQHLSQELPLLHGRVCHTLQPTLPGHALHNMVTLMW